MMMDENYEPNLKKSQKAKASKSKNGRTIEEMYQKKSQLEHILLRPDTYGQISPLKFSLTLLVSWIC
jgi:hypothetical protein